MINETDLSSEALIGHFFVIFQSAVGLCEWIKYKLISFPSFIKIGKTYSLFAKSFGHHGTLKKYYH